HPSITVVFAHGQFDRSPAGEFSYTAMAAAHAMERRMTAEKIKAAYAFRNAQGASTGPLPPGYKWADNGERLVVVDEPCATVVRSIFELYATGRYGSKGLAERIAAEGWLEQMGGSRKRKAGAFWTTINDLLSNVAYIG